MDFAELQQKAADIYRAACHPAMADILYRESIAAVWNPKASCYDAVTIRALKQDRTIPSKSVKVTIRFIAGDATDITSVHKKVAFHLANATRTKKVFRLAKNS